MTYVPPGAPNLIEKSFHTDFFIESKIQIIIKALKEKESKKRLAHG